MSKHTKGPWWFAQNADGAFEIGEGDMVLAVVVRRSLSIGYISGGDNRANARLIAAAPELLVEAKLLRSLAASPRFQHMTVMEALAELKENGCGHDDGAAIAKAEGK